MLTNYLKIAFRSLLRNKLTSFINIAGLSIAMACALLIYLFVKDEVSYEKHHSKADRTYRITRAFHSPEGEVGLHLSNVAPPIGPLLKNDFGEIETLARTRAFNMVINLEENGEVKMSNTEENVFAAEPDLFKIFDIEVLSGDPVKSFARPFTVMLSEKTALRYFNDLNVIGKRLRANNTFDLEVTGVYKDFTDQSHWHPQFLISFITLEDDNVYGRNRLETSWGNNAFGTYFILEEGVDAKNFESRLPAFIDNHFTAYAKATWGAAPDWKGSQSTTLYAQKVSDIHLRSHLDDELEVNGNINNVYMMGIIGLFIMLIACFNFINLSTAHATKRSKEVGLRKVVGAMKTQLINQYLSESILLATVAGILGVVLAYSSLGLLNSFTGKHLSLNLITNWPLLASLGVFALMIGIAAGIYPAFVISSFKPALTLKGQQGSAGGKGFVRKALVVSQFSISIVLIIATLVTFDQLNFMNSRDLGYEKDQVVNLRYYNELAESYDAFYNELTKSATIKNIGRSSRTPTGRLLDSYGSASVLKGDSLVSFDVDLKTVVTDGNFFDTYSIPFAAGRNFSKDVPTDDSLAFIVNEAAAKQAGWTSLDEQIDREFHYAGRKGKLIGIVKDFHFESLHQEIRPMIFMAWSDNFYSLSVKISGTDMKEGLAHLEKTWRQFAPSRPFEYSFLSERYRELYENEQKQSQLFTTFSLLAIFIASLGLFGLATFNTMQRVKEIGIRKVMGASVFSILGILSKEIIILIAVANLIAWPVAWYFMNQWLSSFAYHVDMNVLIYALAAFAAIMLALITVSSQTIKAAMTNPSSTLRYE